MHRDIKPENILLQDGAALVADFGIALAVQQEPPFTGPSSQAIAARVLTEQPPPRRPKRPLVPPAAEAAILRASQEAAGGPLELGPRIRRGAGRERTPRAAVTAPTVPIRAATAEGSARRPAALWLGWVLAGIAAAVAGWALLRPRPVVPPLRLAVLTPGLGGSGASSSQRHLAFLPGGDGLVYSVQGADGQIRLARHPFDADGPVLIEGTMDLNGPVVSPDGRSVVGTSAITGQAFRVPIEGGVREPAAQGALSSDRASWAADGRLWFSSVGQLGVVVGDSLAIRPRSGPYHLEQILPDNRIALVLRNRTGNQAGRVVLVNLKDGTERPLLATPVVEARITSGLLVVVTPGGNLQAIQLTKDGRGVAGPPVTVAGNVAITGIGLAQIAVAPNGNVAYVPEEPFSLVFMDRGGGSRPVLAERHNFHHPMFSRDGRRLSLDFTTGEGRNVWVLALGDGTLSRATFGRDGHDATWAPDGRSLTYVAPTFGRDGLRLALLRKLPGSAESPRRCWSPAPSRTPAAGCRMGARSVTVAQSGPRGRGVRLRAVGHAGRHRHRTERPARARSSRCWRARSTSSTSGSRPTGATSASSPTSRAGPRCTCATSPASRTKCWCRWKEGQSRCGATTAGSCSTARPERERSPSRGRGHHHRSHDRGDRAPAAVPRRRHRRQLAAYQLRCRARRTQLRDGAPEPGRAHHRDPEPAGAGAAAAGGAVAGVIAGSHRPGAV